MLDNLEWIVPVTLVRHADGAQRDDVPAAESPRSATRVAALRGRVRNGYYASASMMDVVARRILASGDA